MLRLFDHPRAKDIADREPHVPQLDRIVPEAVHELVLYCGIHGQSERLVLTESVVKGTRRRALCRIDPGGKAAIFTYRGHPDPVGVLPVGTHAAEAVKPSPMGDEDSPRSRQTVRTVIGRSLEQPAGCRRECLGECAEAREDIEEIVAEAYIGQLAPSDKVIDVDARTAGLDSPQESSTLTLRFGIVEKNSAPELRP
jgi:hypothetical protein